MSNSNLDLPSPTLIIFDHFGVIGEDPLVEWKRSHHISDSQSEQLDRICNKIDRGEIELWPFYAELGKLSNQSDKEVKIELDSYCTYNWDVLSKFASLRLNHGVRIGLLSNAHRSLHVSLWQDGVHDYFDDVITSQEISQVHPKPDPALFLHAVNRLGGQPESTLFFDDREVNVAGARSAGLIAYQYTSSSQLFTDLSKHGLQVD